MTRHPARPFILLPAILLMLAPLAAQGPAPAAAAMAQEGGGAAGAPGAPNPEVEALRTLNRDGWTALNRGDFQRAELLFQQGLERAGTLGDRKLSAVFVNDLGVVHDRRGDRTRALEFYLRALRLREELGDKRDIAASLNNLGTVYTGQGLYDQALEAHTRSLALKEEIGAREDIAASLTNIASIHRRKGDQPRALALQTRALELFREAGDRRLVAFSLSNLGLIHAALGEQEKALDHHQRALALREELGNPQEIATSLNNIALVQSSRARRQEALAMHGRALEIRRKVGNHRDTADSLNNIGTVHLELGRFDQALNHFTQALETEGAQIGKPDLAGRLANIGVVHERLGQLEAALGYQGQALALQREMGQKPGIAGCLLNLGNVFQELGQFDRALECQAEALAIYQETGHKLRIAASLHNIGNLFHILGQVERAFDHHTRALALRREVDHPHEIARSQSHLAQLHLRRGEHAQALKLLNEAVAVLETIGHKLDLASSLNNLGNFYAAAAQREKALEHYERALRLREEGKDPQQIAASLNNIGTVHQANGDWKRAEEFHTRALAIKEPLGNRQDIAVTLFNLGYVYERQKRLAEAEAAYDRARETVEAVTEQIGDPSRIGQYQEDSFSIYHRCAALLVGRGKLSEALAMVERGRGRGLARQAAQSRVDFSGLLSGEDAGRLQSATVECTTATRLLRAAQARPEPSDPKELAAHRAQLDETRHRHQDAERRLGVTREGLLSRYPAYRRVQGEAPPSAARLTELARRHPDTLFLQWAVVDSRRTLLFTLSAKTGLKAFTLPLGRERAAELAGRWRAALTEARPTEPRDAKALYRELLGPAEDAKLLAPGRHARLVVVPDGPLLDLPLAALLDGVGQRLVERFPISTSVSFGVLAWPANPRRATASFLMTADPTPAVPQGTSAARLALRSDLQPLRHARAEGKRVAALFPGALGLVGAEAREGVLKREAGSRRILHFATHGILHPQDGLRSWLLLAPEAPESAEDGRLEAREILSLPLSAQLAVLSACETARGHRSGGDGLMGLAWAFRAAGCGSVVASQWKVDDAATGRLMTHFYQGLKAGKRKDAALRGAMLALRKLPEHQKPFYWAGFTLLGDSSPLAKEN